MGTSLSQNTYKKYDLTYRRMEEYIQFRFRKEKYKDIPLTLDRVLKLLSLEAMNVKTQNGKKCGGLKVEHT